jgi:hypothetical protein
MGSTPDIKALLKHLHPLLTLPCQVKRRIEEKNKLLRAMAAGTGREAAFAVVDLTEVRQGWTGLGVYGILCMQWLPVRASVPLFSHLNSLGGQPCTGDLSPPEGQYLVHNRCIAD